MLPFEIALAIHNRPDADESIRDFALRTMAQERVSDLGTAIELLIGWQYAVEDFKELIVALRTVGRDAAETVDVLVARKRALAYDARFEALLARRWRCPHCKQFATIDKVQVPVGDPERLFRCPTCREEGIAPASTEAHLDVRDGGKSGLRPI